MAILQPNEKCPCGYDVKFKKCCKPYLEGVCAEDANRLARVRHVALIARDYNFLWKTLHPDAPRKKHDTPQNFASELKLLKNLTYTKLTLLDEKAKSPSETILVTYVSVWDGEQDVSYLEESTWKKLGQNWFYFDGLRKSSARLGCSPESIHIGDLSRLSLHDSTLT